jgi:GR25 family glycosyltransferase involved in LPS biosynthesis
MNYFFDNIYVINLDKDKERLKKIILECKKFNIDFQRFSAIDPIDLSQNILDKYIPKYIQQNGTNTMIGCGLSHIFIWQDAIKQNYNNILVFEDDIIISDNFNEILQNAMNELPKDYDILYLGLRDSICKPPKDISFNYIYKPLFPLLTHAMIISKNGLNKLVKYITKINDHIDYLIARNKDKLNIYATKEKVVNQSWKSSNNSELFEFPIIVNLNLNKITDCHNIPLNYELNFQLYKYKNYKITRMTYIIFILGILSTIHNIILSIFLIYFIYDYDKFNLIIFLLGYFIGSIIILILNEYKLNKYLKILILIIIIFINIIIKNNILLSLIKLLL